MEALGDFSNGEWESFSTLFSSLQELDQSLIPMANFNNELQEVHNDYSSSSWFYSLDTFDHSISGATDLVLPIHHDTTNFGSFFSDVFMEEGLDNPLAVAVAAARDCQCQPPPPPPQLVDSAVVTLKRKVINKTRVSGDVEKKKKNKKKRGDESVEEEGNNGSDHQGQSSINYSSEEESHGGSASAATSDRKARASRGSATDPQSLYARKRREKINERLRILQKLVPNGTKVDISTMLEEAVHYVKFLQIQIKLLSSDDMWMFAPLAYNGMDLGLHQKLSPFL